MNQDFPIFTSDGVASISHDSSATPLLAPAATADDINQIFIALLGREPESRAALTDKIGQTLGEAIRGVLASREFSDIAEHLVINGCLPTRPRVDDRLWITAADWVSARLGVFILEAGSPWARILLGLLESEVSALLPENIPLDRLTGNLLNLLERDGEFEKLFSGVFQFDATSFQATYGAQLMLGHHVDEHGDRNLLPERPLPIVLPFFTEYASIFAEPDRPRSLMHLVNAVQAAAREGKIVHWLYDDTVYRQNVQLQKCEAVAQIPSMPGYLEFLAVGDRENVSPSRFFSPIAYRILNPGIEVDPAGCFHHYVRYGITPELRTTALFEPDYYLSFHPQVRKEIATGKMSSALEHFVRVGLRAGYNFSPDFDRDYYLSRYQDVQRAIESGEVPSAEWHFLMVGAKEGRAPNRYFDPDYYARRYPFVGKEMNEHGIGSLLEHFLLFGRGRGWRASKPPVQRFVDLDQSKALFEKRGRRAYTEAIAGVFSYPTCPPDPKLSVVVPISGQADFTAGFLKSARWALDHLELKRGATAEIIIVNNGSKDHTSLLLDALPGIRVVSFDKPIGFPSAVNAGVYASRGEMILVANNDIEFAPDAFLRVFDGLSKNPSIGILGAKIVLPNETLQEVGSYVDRGGATHGLGRGLDSFSQIRDGLVEVDYASGCFIAFMLSDFHALSGFDESYTPGYYEEVDFSLRMLRDRGKPTVVDTGLTVVHYEHASFAKGRPQTSNAVKILTNRALLRSTHPEFFKTKRSAHNTATGRIPNANGPTVLVVEDMIPSSLLGSGFGREEEILGVFKKLGVAFDIFARNASPLVDEYRDPIPRLYRGWMPGESLEDVLKSAGIYTHLWVCRTHNLQISNAAVIEAKKKFGFKVIADTEALSSLRVLEQMRIQGRGISDVDSRSLVAAELDTAIEVDLWIAVNSREAELIQSLGHGPVAQIGHSVQRRKPAEECPGFVDRWRVLFVGAVHEMASPNYDGLCWFLSMVYPKLKAEDRSILTLSIVGYWPEDIRSRFQKRFEGVPMDFLGSVTSERLSAIYDETRVSIAPTRFAAGIPCKVIESVLVGVPIVFTDLLATQLDVDDPSLAIASRFDSGDDFARWMDDLYSDEAKWVAQRDLQHQKIGPRGSDVNLHNQVQEALQIAGIPLRSAGDLSSNSV